MAIERIDSEDQPNRCQAVIKNKGQCTNVGIRLKDEDGQPVYGQYCEAHGGNRAADKQEKESLKNYQLGIWQNRIEKGKASPELKTLRDEIVILRMMLEKRIEHCTSNADLMLHSSAISDMIVKIERVVVSCHKLEKNMGMVLDKQAILNFAGKVIQIITLVLDSDDPKIKDLLNKMIDEVGNRILEEVGKLGEEGEEL